MQKGARSRRQIRDHAGSCRRPPSSRGLVGVGLGSKTPSFSLSLYLILTQAVCRSCGTQCPSPRARTKSPRSRTARRSPPFSTSHRQSCSPSLSLSVWLRSLKCVRLRALRGRKKFLFQSSKKSRGFGKKKRKFPASPATRGGGGRKAYLPQWRARRVEVEEGRVQFPLAVPRANVDRTFWIRLKA